MTVQVVGGEAVGPEHLVFHAWDQDAASQAHALMTWLPWLFASWLLIQPLSLGLTAGDTAAAYGALVPEPPAVSTPDADALEPAAVG